MKSFLTFFSCILLLCTACKKNNDTTPTNTISAQIDGVTESFNTNPTAGLGTSVALNSSLIFFGGNGAGANDDIINVKINASQTITTSSYTSGSDAVGYVSISYKHGPSSILNPNTYVSDPTSQQNTVVIKKLTSTNIQGAFSGKLFYKGASKTVTNGKFNINLLK